MKWLRYHSETHSAPNAEHTWLADNTFINLQHGEYEKCAQSSNILIT